METPLSNTTDNLKEVSVATASFHAASRQQIQVLKDVDGDYWHTIYNYTCSVSAWPFSRDVVLLLPHITGAEASVSKLMTETKNIPPKIEILI